MHSDITRNVITVKVETSHACRPKLRLNPKIAIVKQMYVVDQGALLFCTCPSCDQSSAHVLGSFGPQEKSAVYKQKLQLVNYKQFHSSQFFLYNTQLYL